MFRDAASHSHMNVEGDSRYLGIYQALYENRDRPVLGADFIGLVAVLSKSLSAFSVKPFPRYVFNNLKTIPPTLQMSIFLLSISDATNCVWKFYGH